MPHLWAKFPNPQRTGGGLSSGPLGIFFTPLLCQGALACAWRILLHALESGNAISLQFVSL